MAQFLILFIPLPINHYLHIFNSVNEIGLFLPIPIVIFWMGVVHPSHYIYYILSLKDVNRFILNQFYQFKMLLTIYDSFYFKF
jgi:hypothetical protein